MARYRKKPVVIEARQLAPENGPELWEWADSKPHYGADGKVDGLTIFTLEGRMKARFGDWIIKGVNGEFYPVRPYIFEATYEPIPADTNVVINVHGPAKTDRELSDLIQRHINSRGRQ